MFKFAQHFEELVYKSSLSKHRVNLIPKRVYTHEIFTDLQRAELPTLSLGICRTNSVRGKDHRKYIARVESAFDIHLWTRSVWAKRAWKSV